MRRLLVQSVVLVVLAVPALALASGSSSQVWVTNCTKAQYKPNSILLACADAETYLSKLTWSKWSTSSAAGKGTENEEICASSCAAGGHFEKFPVTVALSKAKSCRRTKHKVFNDLKLTYTGKLPAKTPKTLTLTLGCPY
jgi:hypothetical protein